MVARVLFTTRESGRGADMGWGRLRHPLASTETIGHRFHCNRTPITRVPLHTHEAALGATSCIVGVTLAVNLGVGWRLARLWM